MIGAFAYLVLTSGRNRIVSQLRRVRTPRYAIALVLGLGYFWLIFLNPSARAGRSENAVMGDSVGLVIPIIVLVLALYAWIIGSDRSALAFSQAEVSMLFTAPVSRRGLIIYKLVRSQAPVISTSILWVIFFRRGGAALEQGVSYWVLLSTISLHRLGAALVRASYGQSARTGLRKTWLATTVIGGIAVASVIGFLNARPVLATLTGPSDFPRVVETVLGTAPLRWALLPFTLVSAPAFTSGAEWLGAIVPALVILALHVWWVLRTESAFEEAAAEASTTQAQLIQAVRTRGVTGTMISAKGVRRTLPLRASGPPSLALVWKNYLWILRTGQHRTILGVPLVAAVCTAALAPRFELAAVMIVTSCVAFIVITIFFGPMSMRSDLRRELGRLEMMKTLPLRGRQIMLAEVASSASAVAVMQTLLAVVGVVAAGYLGKQPPPIDIRIGLLIGLPVLVLGLNLANFTIHNGLALLFPAWVRIGDQGSQGVEAMGQVMLVVIITTAMLAIVLVPATLLGAGFWVYFRLQPVLAVSLSSMAAGVMLCVEAYLLIAILGGSLERLEPSQVS